MKKVFTLVDMAMVVIVMVTLVFIAGGILALPSESTAVEHPKPLTTAPASPKTNTVHYLTLEFTQSSFTLSISQHIKDAANAFSVTLPTTENFYRSVEVGDELGSKFKGASFLLAENIGSRKVTVKDKFIRKE